MCYGFVKNTFHLPADAPKHLRHKMHKNKHFNRVQVPKFRANQNQRLMDEDYERSMYHRQEGLDVRIDRNAVLESQRRQRFLKREGGFEEADFIEGSSSRGNLLSMPNQNNNFKRISSHHHQKKKQGVVLLQNPEVRQALGEARRINASRSLSANGKGPKR